MVGLVVFPVPNTSSPTLISASSAVPNATVEEFDTAVFVLFSNAGS
jgi:hypothetical protein